ncbi:MAG: ComF family protein [Myxococcota bacterium]|jgi:ComF family protein
MWSAFLDVVYPEDCPACGQPASAVGGLCTKCATSLPRFLRPIEPPPGIRTAWVLGGYDGSLGDLIRRGKYRPDPSVFQWLGRQLGAASAHRLPGTDAVCWVPVPWRRRAKRGFDQAEQLARPVASAIGVPTLSALRRIRGAEQAGRMRHERAEGARGAFGVARQFELCLPPPARVLLVDDVVTTGATARSCAEELLCGGTERVHLLCVASAHH